MLIKSYSVKGSVNIPNESSSSSDSSSSLSSGSEVIVNDVEILIGSTKSTIVKSLEINAGSEDSIVYIIRRDGSDNEYSKIKIDLKAYNYAILWEGFVVIPYGNKLILNADSNEVECIANVVEM